MPADFSDPFYRQFTEDNLDTLISNLEFSLRHVVDDEAEPNGPVDDDTAESLREMAYQFRALKFGKTDWRPEGIDPEEE